MADDDENAPSQPQLSANVYADLAQHMRLMAARAASAEAKTEYARLAALYEKLAARVIRSEFQPDGPPLERYKAGVLMPLEETYFHYTHESVTSHAPRAAGVYALWNKSFWIYVGSSENIQERLLQHLSGDNECITHEHPTAFGFELIGDPSERAARQAALARDLMPLC